MFTGIIQKLVPLEDKISGKGGEAFLQLYTAFSHLKKGESIAVNGVCLTVWECRKDSWASFYLSPETTSLSNLGNLEKGNLVHLERALRVGDSISGHFVQGHVDGMAMVEKLSPEGESWRLELAVPISFLPYCISKGSIAVDGVSLTINSLSEEGQISIQLIPHTWENTRFKEVSSGDFVNIELDSLAKYVEKQCKRYKELFNN